MFKAPTDRNVLATQDVTFNIHSDAILPESFEKYPALNESFAITSTNYDRDGHLFVSSMEARDFPFYGVQWHPERNNFGCDVNASHTPEAIDVSYSMAKFFVSEARKNGHTFDHASGQDKSVWAYPTLDE
jgi:gamma-glutamyl hydrolase